MTMMPAITVENVGKRYLKIDDAPLLLHAIKFWGKTKRSALWALRDIDFEVGRSETLGVIGRNGSGKSTLLRMLAGVTAPTEGRVRVQGKVAPLISVGVGFNLELTGRENVYVNAAVLGLSRRQINERFDDIVAFAEVDDFIDTPVKFYSSGMYVRLGFAVAINVDPDVLLVDEVLAVGDVRFQMKCFDRMSEIRARGTTVLLVSHNLNAVRNLCDRTIVLHEGRLHFDGPSNEAISQYHDLLGSADASSDADTDGQGPRRAGTVERFELVGPNGEPTRHVESTETATLELDAAINRDLTQAIVGVTVSTETGLVVYSDSTPWTGLGEVKAGNIMRCRVAFRPHLATGTYSVSAGIADENGRVVITPRRPLTFYVAGRRRVRGVADLDAEYDTEIASGSAASETSPTGT